MFTLEMIIRYMDIRILLIGCVILSACNSSPQSEKRRNGEDKAINKTLILNCDSCKVDTYRDLLSDSTSNAENRIYKFLLCINKECFNDAEFSEFSNVLLYSLFQEKPELMLTELNKYKDDSFDYILFVLENPLNEGIDIKKTINQIKNARGDEVIKGKLIESLQKALNSM